MTPNADLSFMAHRIPRDGHALHARQYSGRGPAFVLMHGFPDNLHIYDRLIPFLVAAGAPVVAFDFLGFGASDKPAGYPYSFAQQLGDLEAVIEFLGLEQVILVGHDGGGIAAIDFCLAHPERVSRLCLLNTFYAKTPTLRLPELIELFALPQFKALALAIGTNPAQMGFLLNFQQGQFKVGVSLAEAEVIDTLLKPIITENFMQQPGAGPAFMTLLAQLLPQVGRNTARGNELAAMKVPSVLVWGGSDVYLNRGVAEDLARSLGAPLHVLDAGHWVQMDVPEEVAEYLLAEVPA